MKIAVIAGGRRKTLLLVTGIVAATLVAACMSLEWKPIGPRRTEAVAGATAVGSDECSVCHAVVQGFEKIASYHGNCESCHGPGSLHSNSEALQEIRYPSNQDCLVCHVPGRESHLQWSTGAHSRADLYCSDCHNPHSTARKHLRNPKSIAFPDMDAVSQLCIACHADVGAAQNMPSHHPVGEGALSCLSCHDPHEDARISGGDRNQRCAGCHQDVMGPWIFEHPPAAEDCMTCHNPHGAVGQDLLQTPQPALCLTCHSLNDLWHHNVPGTGLIGNVTITEDYPTLPGETISAAEAQPFLSRCNDCHGAIHGSYTDEHLRH